VSGGAVVNGSAAVTGSAAAAASPAATPPARRLWLATGGTAGHVFPALALAEAARNAGWDVTLLGGDDGPERGWAEAADLPFVGVATGKLDRSRPDPRAGLRALRGMWTAVRAVRDARPDLLVGFGGFASLPGVAAATLTRTPLVLHETNAWPGLVTRWFARAARVVVLTQPATAARLPRARTVVVKLPVRERRPRREDARDALGVPRSATLVLVLGGSQGSAYLNEVVPPIAARLQAEHEDLWVLHQAGPRWATALAADLAPHEDDRSRYRVEGFVDAAVAFAAADLAITRGGYGTLADAAFHGVPLVVVPLPTASEDHQRHNAEALAAEGAGRWVPQGNLPELERAWRALLDPHVRATAAAAARRRSPEGGAHDLLATLAPLARSAEDRAARRSRP
jgi:UDP-N-acetylglucosamine--N-acetylmuramyl-(pentapeptide) pyrophosphoryl-undecaprenol N-acetylglucosamine transferase